jgi:malate synthase
MNADRSWTRPDGGELTLPGRVVLLVRNVGLHVYTNAVMMPDGAEIPGMLTYAHVCSRMLAYADALPTALRFAESMLGGLKLLVYAALSC